MQIVLKNKDTLLFGEFKFKCSIGKKGITSKKFEGDKKYHCLQNKTLKARGSQYINNFLIMCLLFQKRGIN